MQKVAPKRSKNGGVLASRVAEVKESHVHASTVKKAKLDEADSHRPMSMMQCMVAVIKQNLLSALRALGAGSSRTVTENLTNDGVINADNNPAAAPKERRFMTIWP